MINKINNIINLEKIFFGGHGSMAAWGSDPLFQGGRRLGGGTRPWAKGGSIPNSFSEN
jgi:hypothetical protein